MNIKSLSAGLSFRGNVTGRRQKYYVFEGKDAFFVFSFSKAKPKAGYFNMVSAEAVAYVKRLTGGEQGVTAQALNKRTRRPKLVGSALSGRTSVKILSCCS